MKLYLIRHGQTDWNMAGRVQGSTDIPLNETGRRQAECLAQGMKERPVVRIFSSVLKRALETAAVIGESQHVSVEQIQGLEEVGLGEWEGKTWEEVRCRYPKEFEQWRRNPADMAPPGGESSEEIRKRCKNVMRFILAQAQGDLAIVSHGAVLAYLLDGLMKKYSLEKEIIVENASITTVEYVPAIRDFVLVQMNDIRHLAALK